MKDLEGMHLTFKKSALAAFRRWQLKIILIFAAISNRLKLLEADTFSHWATAKDESRSEPVRNAALCGVVESLILLAGELKEAWESIQHCYHSTQVSKKLNARLPESAQDGAEALRQPLRRGWPGLLPAQQLRQPQQRRRDAENREGAC